MPPQPECYVYVVLPGGTEFVTAGRFSLNSDRQGQPVGTFVYGRRYRERPDAVELDPVQLRLRQGSFETARLGGFFGARRDALPDHWGRRVIARHGGLGEPSDFDLLLLGPDDRCGAVNFGRGVEPPASQRASTAGWIWSASRTNSRPTSNAPSTSASRTTNASWRR